MIVFQYLITVLFYNTYEIDWFNQRQKWIYNNCPALQINQQTNVRTEICPTLQNK